jgi:hypothetical protein
MPMALGVAAVVTTGVSMIQQRNAASRAADQTAAASALLAQNQIDVADRNALTIENVAKANSDALLATSNYNARVMRSEESQVGIDSAANIRAMRKDAATYLSRQRAAFAGSGIRVDTGSPLAVRVATAGQFALREAEAHRQTVAKMEGIESRAKATLAEAQSRSDLSLYEAKSRADLTRYEGQKAAEATRITGQAQADRYHAEGTAALLNGASRMLTTGYDLYQGGAFTPSSSPALSSPSKPLGTTFDVSGPITTGGYA